MTQEVFDCMDELENVVFDCDRSFDLWEAARIMEIDEDDKEHADVLYSIFGERISGEIERLKKAYYALHAVLSDESKIGF